MLVEVAAYSSAYYARDFSPVAMPSSSNGARPAFRLMRDYVETLDEAARRSIYEHTAVFQQEPQARLVVPWAAASRERVDAVAMLRWEPGCVETAHWPGAVAPLAVRRNCLAAM